jgi:hypothetical protein
MKCDIIIVGCGKGIILSRFISEDIFREVINTKRYLQRLKIDSVKMFSNIDDFSDADKIDLDDVFKFIDQKNSIRPLFEKNHSLLIAMLYTIICFLLFWIAITINQCSSYDFSQFKLFSKINDKNICGLQIKPYSYKVGDFKALNDAKVCNKKRNDLFSDKYGIPVVYCYYKKKGLTFELAETDCFDEIRNCFKI